METNVAIVTSIIYGDLESRREHEVNEHGIRNLVENAISKILTLLKAKNVLRNRKMLSGSSVFDFYFESNEFFRPIPPDATEEEAWRFIVDRAAKFHSKNPKKSDDSEGFVYSKMGKLLSKSETVEREFAVAFEAAVSSFDGKTWTVPEDLLEELKSLSSFSSPSLKEKRQRRKTSGTIVISPNLKFFVSRFYAKEENVLTKESASRNGFELKYEIKLYDYETMSSKMEAYVERSEKFNSNLKHSLYMVTPEKNDLEDKRVVVFVAESIKDRSIVGYVAIEILRIPFEFLLFDDDFGRKAANARSIFFEKCLPSNVRKNYFLNTEPANLLEIKGLSADPELKGSDVGKTLLFVALDFFSTERSQRIFSFSHVVSQAASYVTRVLLCSPDLGGSFSYVGRNRYLNEDLLETLPVSKREGMLSIVVDFCKTLNFLIDSKKNAFSESSSFLDFVSSCEDPYAKWKIAMTSVIRCYQTFFLINRSFWKNAVEGGKRMKSKRWIVVTKLVENGLKLVEDSDLDFSTTEENREFSSVRMAHADYFRSNLEYVNFVSNLDGLEEEYDETRFETVVFPSSWTKQRKGTVYGTLFATFTVVEPEGRTVKLPSMVGYSDLFETALRTTDLCLDAGDEEGKPFWKTNKKVVLIDACMNAFSRLCSEAKEDAKSASNFYDPALDLERIRFFFSGKEGRKYEALFRPLVEPLIEKLKAVSNRNAISTEREKKKTFDAFPMFSPSPSPSPSTSLRSKKNVESEDIIKRKREVVDDASEGARRLITSLNELRIAIDFKIELYDALWGTWTYENQNRTMTGTVPNPFVMTPLKSTTCVPFEFASSVLNIVSSGFDTICVYAKMVSDSKGGMKKFKADYFAGRRKNALPATGAAVAPTTPPPSRRAPPSSSSSVSPSSLSEGGSPPTKKTKKEAAVVLKSGRSSRASEKTASVRLYEIGGTKAIKELVIDPKEIILLDMKSEPKFEPKSSLSAKEKEEKGEEELKKLRTLKIETMKEIDSVDALYYDRKKIEDASNNAKEETKGLKKRRKRLYEKLGSIEMKIDRITRNK